MGLSTMGNALSTERYAERLEGAARLVRERGLAALLVGVGPDMRYLAGYPASPSERLTLLVVLPGRRPTLIAPRLELAPARLSPSVAGGLVELVGWEETEDPHGLAARLVRDGGGSGSVAVSDLLTAMHLLKIQSALPGVPFVSAAAVMKSLRIVKHPDEIEILRRAGAAADRVVDAIAAGKLVGRTEADVSREVYDRLQAEGHQTPTFGIVASGPNSASPHHASADRVIGPGDAIVLDLGGLLDGYGSDTTRTLWVTGGDPAHHPDDEFLRLYAILHAAQVEATHAVRPGVPAERIDAVAREIISAGSHGAHFIHRVGHGIGVEGHEDPYLVAGNGELLAEGMAFSVEPGIYLEGRYGARIEDIVVCGAEGPIILNNSSRELRVVDGR
jgi:Xaa-Pro aminopeptidase